MAQVFFILAAGDMQVYRARNPKKSPLWQCAHRHYDEFEAAYPEAYQPRFGNLRPIISEVVHKFLDCGNLERGFARVRCDLCQHEYLLAFSCKSRWFCPSCHQKNVQTTARFILDQVVAPVAHRHYVLAIPKMLRPYFQRHRHLLKRLCTLAHESLTLAQYILRNPFSVEKMTMEAPADMVIYRSRLNAKINRNFEVFTATDFLAAITQHIPDKGAQMVRYYGWYSNKMRGVRQRGVPPELVPRRPGLSPPPPRQLPSKKWRDVILRVWHVDPLRCPCCITDYLWRWSFAGRN